MSSALFECIEHTSPSQHIRHYPRATSRSQEEGLQLCVKQYKPLQTRYPNKDLPAVTVLAAPALSCAKELYEPIWDAVYEYSCREDAAFRIWSIWSVDFVNQGKSGVVNERMLGDERKFTHRAQHSKLVSLPHGLTLPPQLPCSTLPATYSC